MRAPRKDRRGFVLVLTLALLALLVLAAVGIAASARLAMQLAETDAHRATARQHALLGLGVALGELQRRAGRDDAVTAMAGVTGVVSGSAGAKTRHWCGVWTAGAAAPVWLVSGAQNGGRPGLLPGTSSIVLVGANTVGAEAANSEHVVAGRVPITTRRTHANAEIEQGAMAWWVGDEGVKITAHSPSETHAHNSIVLLPPVTPTAANRLREALLAQPANRARLLTFEQLRFLPSPAAPLALGTVRDNFHSVTLTARYIGAEGIARTGAINLNTTNAIVWRALFATFAAAWDGKTISNAQIDAAALRMQNNFAARNSGRPFRNVAEFAASDLLADAVKGMEIEPSDFAGLMENLITTRSDTFRVRAYGEATQGAGTAPVATAVCEAIVQRTVGGRFVVSYFRWLGPDDL